MEGHLRDNGETIERQLRDIGETMERHWRDNGETMERHLRDNGETMERQRLFKHNILIFDTITLKLLDLKKSFGRYFIYF